ncbi:MAG: ATP:cob(I)alamin adenosyltransferase [Alkalispirochaeta sp.]
MSGFGRSRRRRWTSCGKIFGYRICTINTEEESPVRTGGGDDGKSSLLDGVRRPKDDIAFETLGSVDEAQVTLGVCRSLVREWRDRIAGTEDTGARSGKRNGLLSRSRSDRFQPGTVALLRSLDEDLARIQNELLIAGGILSTSIGDTVPETMPRIGTAEIEVLSKTFARWRGVVHIEPRFFIAGDSRIGAEFDRARTVIRRAERNVVRLIRERGNQAQIPVSQYLNQLSDLCFVLARWTDTVSDR